MPSNSYLVAATTKEPSLESFLPIFNKAGMGRMLLGQGLTTWWIIPNGKKTNKEVITDLQDFPIYKKVTIIALSNPIDNSELAEIRSTFTEANLDTSNISDEALSKFIQARVEGKHTYYLDFLHEQGNRNKMLIKLTEEHPEFTPDWLKPDEEEIIEGELTMDDFETETVELSISVDEPEPPQPPPPPGDEDGSDLR